MVVTEDLKTGTFLRCFRKFIAQRGVPQLVISDNAKTFKTDLQASLTEKTIIWRFNL